MTSQPERKKIRAVRDYWSEIAGSGAILLLAIYLILRTYPLKRFSEHLLVWDIQWLNAWSIIFALALVAVWCGSSTRKNKARLSAAMFALYGLVSVCLLLDGTPFSYNAFWGDQNFRQAMILKFTTFAIPTDFYYKGLPPFYPPLYYLLLSVYARLFSVEPYKMLKIGSMLIYLLGSGLLYYFWSRVTSHRKAVFVTVATFMYGSIYPHMIYAAPHEFLANVFFIPWWLYFVERLRNLRPSRSFYALGGLIGGAIFMTYYYVFFIGGVFIIARLLIQSLLKRKLLPDTFRLKSSLIVLGLAALVSSPYWLPLMWSMIKYGSDPAQREWFRIGYASMNFEFLSFSLQGILYLGSMALAAGRFHLGINRALLGLTATSVIFYVIGYVLGNIGSPILYVKAGEFIMALGGAFVGLAFATLLSAEEKTKRKRYAVVAVGLVSLLFFMNSYTGLVRDKHIEIARTSRPLSWNLDPQAMMDREGTVFLAGHEKLQAFYPVYSFLALNQHYSHHASEFEKRYEFLYLLQSIEDPYLFSVCLRHNVFDEVDYFMPAVDGDDYQLPIGLSNYPAMSYQKTLRYDPLVVSDTSLFERQKGDELFRLVRPQPRLKSGFSFDNCGSLEDSLICNLRLRLLSESLTNEGQELLSAYTGLRWSGWTDNLVDRGHQLSSGISMEACYRATAGDSVAVLLALRVDRDISTNYGMMLRVSAPDGTDEFSDYPIALVPTTAEWRKGDMVLCCRLMGDCPTGSTIDISLLSGDQPVDNSYRTLITSD